MAQTLYRGPAIGGDYVGNIHACVAVATGNEKTAEVLTLWVLPETAPGVKPLDAIQAGADTSTCGKCPHRSQASGGTSECYTHPGASQVLSAGAASISRTADAPVRVPPRVKRARSAAFGDAAALPLEVLEAWRSMRTELGLAPLGYTHAWRTRPDLMSDHMASVDTEEERLEAKAMGWRTFRVRPIGAPLMAGERQCPAVEGVRDNPMDCSKCGGCDGLTRKLKVDFSIENHGKTAKSQRRIALKNLRLSAH